MAGKRSKSLDGFGRLLIVANARQVNLKEVSQLADILEKNVEVFPQIQSTPSNTVYIMDGMAVVQMMKSANAVTFGELAVKYYDFFTSPLPTRKCKSVHVVFDQYVENSIKSGERSRRGTSSALEVLIRGPHTPVPKQWVNTSPTLRTRRTCVTLSPILCAA